MMKKILMLLTFVATFAAAHAGNGVTVSEATASKGGKGTISIMLNNDDYTFTAFFFKLTLPEGLSFVINDKGEPFSSGDRFSDHSIFSELNGQTATFTCLSGTSAPISGTSGMLLSVNIEAGESLNVGDKLTAALSEIEFATTSTEAEAILFDNATFDIEIVENRILLDELSTTMPEAAEGVNVRVKRTIKANEWSTLVLPFAMTAEQAKSAFGDDVKLADFTGYVIEEDADENVVGIQVNFDAVTAIEANRPCLIKVSKAITDFMLDNVDIAPEDEPVNAIVDKRKEWSKLVGTYVADTEVFEYCLFLNGNKFWYSTGATKMKAFRAYFDFSDILTEMEEAESKIRFVVEDAEATDIEGVASEGETGSGVYTLQGVALGDIKDVESLPKGVYIVNGKKVSVK